MATIPQRISVKLFAAPDPAAPFDATPFIALFHAFIRDTQLEGLLLDVADYRHIPQGPGVILIGHDVDYGIDRTGGRTGLLTLRKRCEGATLAELLRDTLRKALAAADAIASDGSTGLSLATNSFEITIFDRLAAANNDENREKLGSEIEAVLNELFEGSNYEVATSADQSRDPRTALGLLVRGKKAEALPALLSRLPKAAPAAAGDAASWEIAVEELKRLRDQSAEHRLIDVREASEFEVANLGGELIPLSTLAEKLSELPKDAYYVVHCAKGGRSAQAVKAMREAGFGNAWTVRGGIDAWRERIDPDLPGG